MIKENFGTGSGPGSGMPTPSPSPSPRQNPRDLVRVPTGSSGSTQVPEEAVRTFKLPKELPPVPVFSERDGPDDFRCMLKSIPDTRMRDVSPASSASSQSGQSGTSALVSC